MMNKPALKQQMRAVGADLARAADRIARGDALGATERLYDGLRRLAGAVGLVIDAEAPQDVQEPAPAPAPVAIVTDDQVRTFAREWQGRGNARVAEMLFNAAHTIESLSREVCEARKKIARLEQESWR